MTENTKSLAPGLLGHRVEFKRNEWHVSVPSGFTLADLENPQTWRHATSLGEGDLIEAVSDSGDFDALFRVLSVGTGFAVLRRLRCWTREEKANVAALDGQSLQGVRFLPDRGWCAFDRDGTLVSVHSTPGEAETALYVQLAGVEADEEEAEKPKAKASKKKEATA